MDLLADVELRSPWFLLACLTGPVLFVLARRAGGHLIFSSFRALPTHGHTWRTRLAWIPDLLVALAGVALGISLAGPRTPDRSTRVQREGIAIVMVVDTSGSMEALDLDENLRSTRLDVVKEVLEDFVHGGAELPGRPNDAVGVVSFARYADTRCPLTLDHANVIMVARGLEIVKERSEDGTAMGDGLGLAVERLRESTARSKVAILLTDGVNNAGVESPVAAAELARAQDVKVYTIGAGTNGLAPIRTTDPFTGREVLRRMPVEIDEQSLQEIAERTGGSYFRATDGDSLRDVYAEIDRLERTELTEERFRQYHEHYDTALAIGLLLACLGWLIRAGLFRRLP